MGSQVPIEGVWTLIVGMTGFIIPMVVLLIAIRQTAPHGFACTRCDRDVPLGSARCPNCGAPILNADQPL